jgi:hypothetical protein
VGLQGFEPRTVQTAAQSLYRPRHGSGPEAAFTVPPAARRFERAGRLASVSGDWTVNTAFLGEPDARRETGRPKLRWLHCSENDLKSMRVKR